MKTKFILLISTVAMLSFSCKKVYTCDCETTWTDSSGSMVNKNSSEEYSAKLTEKQAQAACDHEAMTIETTGENILTFNGAQSSSGTISTDCELN